MIGRGMLPRGSLYSIIVYVHVERLIKPLFYIIGRPSPHMENRVQMDGSTFFVE